MSSLFILKIGGELLQSSEKCDQVLQYFVAHQGPKILVHGGGRDASLLSERMGMQPHLIDGRRVTDAPQLDVVTMVYAGKVNTQLVARLNALGQKALGINGSDLGIITCDKRPNTPIDYGFVGDIRAVDGSVINELLKFGITPVFSAITSDGQGQLLNTNADTVATAVATVLTLNHTVKLTLLMGIPGILRDLEDSESLIKKLDYVSYEELKVSGALSGGILPKLHNGFQAINNGVSEVIIANEETLINHQNTLLCR
ncbi:MAG: acetylglutamate kinase [Flavobacteriaceae bacterium]